MQKCLSILKGVILLMSTLTFGGRIVNVNARQRERVGGKAKLYMEKWFWCLTGLKERYICMPEVNINICYGMKLKLSSQ